MFSIRFLPPEGSRPGRARPVFSVFAFAVLLAGSRGVRADEHAGHDLGRVHFPVSCSAAVQAPFDRAVALLHHMTYPAAREAFRRVSSADPACAMAYWGVAMTLFQPLWPTRPGPEALGEGWEAVRKAKALAPPTERERLFIGAAEAFFLDPGSPDYWLRIRRWEQAMEKVYSAFPDDDEADAFYALALLATAPPDSSSHEHQDRAAGILIRVYRRNPDHPGAMHYLVHADDVPGREREFLEITRRYESLAPDNPHALHMPTHIYTRLGDWDGSIRGNRRAADAALRYPAGERGEYVWDEFPHAIEYLVYADLQKGADEDAAAQVKRLTETAHLEPTFKTAFHLASTRARYALERRAWGEAARLVPRDPGGLPWDRFPWAEGVTRFANGLGAAHLGRLDDARAAAERLKGLEAASAGTGEDSFTRMIRILRLELEAWIAHAGGHEEIALAGMRDASALEASTPKPAVTPAPTLPADELMGDLLTEQGQPSAALASYRRDLELYPRRFNALLGAARAAAAAGDDPGSRGYYRQLLEVADPASPRAERKEAEDRVRAGPPPAGETR